MRLPGTLKELRKQLEAFPVPVQRVEIPTKEGPLVLEFAVSRAPAAEKAPEVPSEPKMKTRDTRLLTKTPPRFEYDPPPEAPPS